MAKEVPWTKIIMETFITEACLTKEEEIVLRTRCAGWSRVRQADELGMSLSSIDRIIKNLKKKYDQVQKYDPILPPRRMSKQEEIMDTIPEGYEETE